MKYILNSYETICSIWKQWNKIKSADLSQKESTPSCQLYVSIKPRQLKNEEILVFVITKNSPWFDANVHVSASLQ